MKVKFNFDFKDIHEEELFEFDDNSSEDEIDQTLADWVHQIVDSSYEILNENGTKSVPRRVRFNFDYKHIHIERIFEFNQNITNSQIDMHLLYWVNQTHKEKFPNGDTTLITYNYEILEDDIWVHNE